MSIQNQKDFFAGLMFMALGGAFAWGATSYSVGTAARMGPGYFPLVLGVVLALLGVAITVKATLVRTEDGQRIGPWAWRQVFFVLAANFAFGLLLGGIPSIGIPPMGLIAAIYALTFIASLAAGPLQWRQTAVLATVLALGSYGAFVWALQLHFPVWPSFIAA